MAASLAVACRPPPAPFPNTIQPISKKLIWKEVLSRKAVLTFAHNQDLTTGIHSPALVSFGSHLGLNHIDGEASTNDGNVIDPLKSQVPNILGQGSIIRAVDGLQFSTRDALYALFSYLYIPLLSIIVQSRIPIWRHHWRDSSLFRRVFGWLKHCIQYRSPS